MEKLKGQNFKKCTVNLWGISSHAVFVLGLMGILEGCIIIDNQLLKNGIADDTTDISGTWVNIFLHTLKRKKI